MNCQFVFAEDVKDKMALQANTSASNPAINAALASAHFRMESELTTRFDQGSQLDTFLLDPSKGYVVPDGYFRLRLSRGFVRASPAVVVTSYDSAADAFGGTGGTDITALCRVSKERGHVFVPECDGTGKYVTVQYDYGFVYVPPPSGQTRGTFTGEQPPDWLKEAVLSYVPAAFYMGQPTNRKGDAAQGTKGINSVIDTASAHALAVIAPHNRTIAFSLLPVFSSP